MLLCLMNNTKNLMKTTLEGDIPSFENHNSRSKSVRSQQHGCISPISEAHGDIKEMQLVTPKLLTPVN